MNQTFSTRTMWHSFVCALVATFTLAVRATGIQLDVPELTRVQSMDPFRTGKLVLFQVSYDRDWHYFELPAFILIGIFGASAINALLVFLLTDLGLVRRTGHQIQSTSSCIPTKESRRVRSGRSSHTRHYHRDHWLFEPVPPDRHDRDDVPLVQGM